MGYMTVAMLLNDAMSELAKSPKTLAHLLTFPRSPGVELLEHIDAAVKLGKADGENPASYFSGAIKVLPTFHADECQFLLAGHNTIVPMEFVKYGHTPNGSLTVTLIVPDYVNPRAAQREKAKAKVTKKVKKT